MKSMLTVFDVAIVGGGPSGSSAALELIYKGYKVGILEKAPLPRYKPCGGGLVPRTLRLLPPGLSETIERKCSVVEVRASGTHFYHLIQRPYSIISMIMRDNFDHALVSKAKAGGAQLICPVKIKNIFYEKEKVKLITNMGKIEAQYIIGADGATSFVARNAGFPPLDYIVPAIESEIRVGKEVFGRFKSRARFDLNALPFGYGWVFPKKAHLSIGIGRIRKSKGNLESHFQKYVRFLGIHKWEKIQKNAWSVPVYPRPIFARKRILLVGDAAGIADPVMGEGISGAILSGKLAALSIIKGRFNERRVIELYIKQLKNQILDDYEWGRKISRLLYEVDPLKKLLFTIYGRRMCELMVDVMSGNRTYKQILRNPLTYLGLLRPVDKGRSFH